MTDAARPEGLSIIHIEDEYAEFRGLIQTVRLIIEDHLSREDILFVSAKKIASDPATWEAYQFSCDTQVVPVVRYVFVRDKTVPLAAREVMLRDCVFVVDALRVEDGSPELRLSARESIKDIEANYGVDSSDVVVFTAYTGTGEFGGKSGPVRKIYKTNDDELERFLSERIVAFLKGER